MRADESVKKYSGTYPSYSSRGGNAPGAVRREMFIVPGPYFLFKAPQERQNIPPLHSWRFVDLPGSINIWLLRSFGAESIEVYDCLKS
jgi:hypothetical protein